MPPLGPQRGRASPPFWPYGSFGAPPPPVLSPRAWYKYDVGVTLAGAAVTGWADQSGNHFDVAQANAARQPQYTPGVDWGLFFRTSFDGDALDYPGSILATPGQSRSVLGLVMPGGAFGGTLCTFQSSVPAFNVLFENLAARQYIYSDDTPGASEPPNAYYDLTPQDRTGQVLVYAMRVLGLDIVDVRINTVPMAIVSPPHTYNTDVGTPSFRIGNQMDGIAFRGWQGWMREEVIFDDYLPDAELATWEAYLTARGAIP